MSATATVALRVEHARHAGQRELIYVIEEGKPLVIGRGTQADFRPSVMDKRISRTHATLELVGDALEVVNHSVNGIFVGDDREKLKEEHARRTLGTSGVFHIGGLRIEAELRPLVPMPGGELIGEEFDGYVVESVISRGALGVLYRGVQAAFGRQVAIKTLQAQHLANPDVATRFLKVAKLAGVLGHPNVVQALDSGELADRGLYYLVLEYVDGCTLSERLEVSGPLSVVEALDLARGIGGALAYAHARKIVHRDVNPDNVMLDANQTPKLIGLGLAKSLGGDVTTLTRTGMTMGRINYLAPEQTLDASTVDHRADIFGLGGLLYAALTGRAPYDSTSRRDHFQRLLRKELPPAVHTLAPAVPPRLSAMIEQSLAFDPEDRQVSVGAMLEQFASLDSTPAAASMDRAKRHFLAMFPDAPDLEGFECAALFRPVDAVGGDFYDFFAIDEEQNQWGVVMGDISGHGVEAAIVTGMAKTCCRIYGRQHGAPAPALAAANAELHTCLTRDCFAAAAFGVLDVESRTFCFARGGQCPPLLYSPSRQSCERLEPSGAALGMIPPGAFRQQEHVVFFEPGDVVLLYTDGVIEAMDPDGEFFDLERLMTTLSESPAGESAQALVDRIGAAVDAFTGVAGPDDDVTIVALIAR